MKRLVLLLAVLIAGQALVLQAPAQGEVAQGLPAKSIITKTCSKVLPKVACQIASAGIGATNPVLGATGVADSPVGDLVGGVLGKWSPSNIIDSWAKDAATGAADLLGQIQELLLKTTKPDLGKSWFRLQYGVTWGLGLLVMAFALVLAGGRASRGGPEERLLAQEAMTRGLTYVPLMAIAVPLIGYAVDLSYSLASWFGTDAQANAHTAIATYVNQLTSINDPNTEVQGGVLSLLVFGLVTFLAALFNLVEMEAAKYGVYVLALLLPVATGLAVYPKLRGWSRAIIGALVAVLVIPVFLFLAYWVLWGAAAGDTASNAAAGKTTPMEVFSTLAFVATATLIAVSAPVALGFGLAHMLPDGHQSHMAVSGGIRSAGSSAQRSTARMSQRLGRLSAARGGGGGRAGAAVAGGPARAGGAQRASRQGAGTGPASRRQASTPGKSGSSSTGPSLNKQAASSRSGEKPGGAQSAGGRRPWSRKPKDGDSGRQGPDKTDRR